jgi:S1-C subfamily serine protease
MKKYLKFALVSLVGAFVLLSVPLILKGYCGVKISKWSDFFQTTRQSPPVAPQPQFKPKPWGREPNSTGQQQRNWWKQPYPTRQTEDFLSEAQLRQQAKLITVKVLSGLSSGSGIILKKQGQVYTVLTNHHVLIFGQANQSYRIQAFDDQVYSAKVVKIVNIKDSDLGLLTFHSQQKYQIASLSDPVNLSQGEEVFAAGFPFEVDGATEGRFSFSKGRVQMWSDRAFGGGYQIGSTISLKKGMSGGPLLNHQGKVIGINGIHKYPLWGNPYVFADNSIASVEEKEQMQQLSWAIPVQTFRQLVSQPLNSE